MLERVDNRILQRQNVRKELPDYQHKAAPMHAKAWMFHLGYSISLGFYLIDSDNFMFIYIFI